MRIAYADPPYPGCAHLYRDHPDYAGEVDHVALVYKLVTEYDGYCLHTSSPALYDVLERFSIEVGPEDRPRIMAWTKGFAAFKRNVSVAYAWEPVLVKAARKPVVKEGMTYRDFINESITLKKGLTGAKPEKVCHWLFEVMGCDPEDELDDLYPGTGAVADAWETWKNTPSLLRHQSPLSPWIDVAEQLAGMASNPAEIQQRVETTMSLKDTYPASEPSDG